MMTLHSWLVGEVHHSQHSMTLRKPPTRNSVTPLDEWVSHHRGLDEWGHLMKKQGMTLWIAFQNIGGFLQEEEMEMKLEAMWCFMSKREIDIMRFTEANTCWDLLPKSQCLSKQTRGWWETSQ